jgi:peptide/nickel transport system permease protein
MAAATAPQVGALDIPLRKIGRLERLVGPEWYRVIKGLATNPLSVFGLSLILFFILVAAFAPVLAPPTNTRDPYIIPRDGFGPVPEAPGSVWTVRPPELPFWWRTIMRTDEYTHIMGTASGQFDIWHGIIWGTRTALRVGLTIESITLVVGLLVGSFAAFYGGWLDEVLMRITDIFLTFPPLLAALTLATILTPVLGKSLWPAIIALTAFGWMTYARLIRGDILSVRERDFVTAARVVGAKDSRVLFRHIVPNAIYPTLVVASLNIGADVISFAALSFLGIGTEVGYSDWGQLISFGRNWIPTLSTYWWLVVFPGFALLLFVLGFNLVGDALRDVMDPRLRGRR